MHLGGIWETTGKRLGIWDLGGICEASGKHPNKALLSELSLSSSAVKRKRGINGDLKNCPPTAWADNCSETYTLRTGPEPPRPTIKKKPRLSGLSSTPLGGQSSQTTTLCTVPRGHYGASGA